MHLAFLRKFSTLQPAKILTAQWWSQPFYGLHQKIQAPIYDFKSLEKTSENIELDSEIFGQPLRRDLIHNAFWYYEKFGQIKTHQTRTIGEIAGSGKKPFAQKKTGRAPQGHRRGPHQQGGYKPHGPKLRDISIEMPAKKLLLANKCMLSAKLAEEKLKIVQNIPEFQKTKELVPIVSLFGNVPVLLIVDELPESLSLAMRNIYNKVNVHNLLKAHTIVITPDTLEKLQKLLKEQHKSLFCNRKIQTKETPQTEVEKVPITSRMLKDIARKLELDI